METEVLFGLMSFTGSRKVSWIRLDPKMRNLKDKVNHLTLLFINKHLKPVKSVSLN